MENPDKTSPLHRPDSRQPISRSAVIHLLQAALQVGEYRYARQIGLSWLGFFPGDLPVNVLYARALLGLGAPQQALEVLERVTQRDPEDVEALNWLYKTQASLDLNTEISRAGLFVLTGKLPEGSLPYLPAWAEGLRTCYTWLNTQSAPSGGALLPTSAAEQGEHRLAKLIHLRLVRAQAGNLERLRSLAQEYLPQEPDCVGFRLILAEAVVNEDPDQAVALIHEAVTLDTTAQVAARLWGAHHHYRELWPASMEITPNHSAAPQQIAVPARLAAYLGWNQLNPPSPGPLPPNLSPHQQPGAASPIKPTLSSLPKEPSQPQPVTQQKSTSASGLGAPIEAKLRKAQAEVKQIAHQMKQPAIGRLDGRFPVYVLLATRQGLIAQYGLPNADLIDQELRRLAGAVSQYKRWTGMVFYSDQPDFKPARQSLNLLPARPGDAWATKLALRDLDAALEKSGEMIGALLIIGGPQVIPFHHLPNPVDDSDQDVPSDNPYATRDENYFVPEWPVGRLPGGEGADPQMLLKALRRLTADHTRLARQQPWHQRIWFAVSHALSMLLAGKNGNLHSYGYSAAVWRRASLSVFRPIGDPRQLLVCPPTQVTAECALNRPKNACLTLPKGRMAYFNLHGLPDTDEWYGQKDPTEPAGELEQDENDFPLAFRAADIGNNDSAIQPPVPEVVFSEACYGGHILGKTIDQAIALKFLSRGSRAVIGSTSISYGSINAPLIGADLLGHTFWQYLRDGQPAGEALRRAKIHLAREMHSRQGYLDGEDQKTLLSFVLYGDPLLQISDKRERASFQAGPKTTARPQKHSKPVPTVCDHPDEDENIAPIPAHVMAQVKTLVNEYLPGMQDAAIHINHERKACAEHAACSAPGSQAKHTSANPVSGRQVVTLSKTIRQKSLRHEQFARITLDPNGKMVKLVISR